MSDLDPSELPTHRYCGCPEQYKDRDCPACRGTGLIPPVTRAEYEALCRRFDEARVENERLRSDCEHVRAEARAENEELRAALDYCTYRRIDGHRYTSVLDHVRLPLVSAALGEGGKADA